MNGGASASATSVRPTTDVKRLGDSSDSSSRATLHQLQAFLHGTFLHQLKLLLAMKLPFLCLAVLGVFPVIFPVTGAWKLQAALLACPRSKDCLSTIVATPMSGDQEEAGSSVGFPHISHFRPRP